MKKINIFIYSATLCVLGYCVCYAASENSVQVQNNAVSKQAGIDIFSAVSAGDISKVSEYINNQGDINVQNSAKMTPLIIAIENRKTDIAKLLIENGAKDIAAADFQPSPLKIAIKSKQTDIAKLIIERIAQLDVNNYGRSVLEYAAMVGDMEIVQLLMSKGIDFNVQRSDILVTVASNGNLDVIKLLLDKGADINRQNMLFKTTALIAAASNANLDVVRFLVEKGANLDLQDKEQRTALMYASTFEIAQLLVGKTNLDVVDKNGYTALMLAIRDKKNDIAKLIIDKSTKLDVQTNTGATPLILAAINGEVDVAQALIAKGVALDAHDIDTPLVRFVIAGRMKSTELPINDNYTDNTYGMRSLTQTAIMLADSARNKNQDLDHLQTLILERTIDINVKNGATALMWGALEEQKEIVKLLLEKGADVNAKDDSGNTALIFAALAGNTDIAQLLIDKGAQVDVQDLHKNTALIWAVRTKQIEMVKFLINKGANKNVLNDDYKTALMIAKKMQLADIVAVLSSAS